jgi:hypothetical protein
MLDALDLSNIKCYSMCDCSDDELIKYFHLIYKSCDDYRIIHRDAENSIMNITTKYEEDLNIKTRKKTLDLLYFPLTIETALNTQTL